MGVVKGWCASAAAVLVAGVVAVVVAPGAVAAGGPASHDSSAGDPVLRLIWHDPIADNGGGSYIALSSPNVADLTGGPSVVVGDMSGNVYAFHLETGTTVPNWKRQVTGGVTSTPSVVMLPGATTDTVLVGSGNAYVSCTGGYQWLSPAGAHATVLATNPSTDRACAHNGVQASMAVGTLQGVTATVAGSLGQETYAMNVASHSTLAGFPWFQADSNFATPAIADVDGTGTNQIIEGGASTAGSAYGKTYTNGGHIRVLNGRGQLVCEHTTTESINSSPAVGTFLSGTAVGIVAGTGSTYPDASAHDQIIAVKASCAPAWSRTLAGTTGEGSPALADVLGNGALQVVATTRSGGVWVLDGSTGAVVWHTQLRNGIVGSPVTAAFATGHQDVVVASVAGFDVLTGVNGAVLDATVAATTSFESAPLVTDDANGTIGITVAGHHASGSVVWHYEIATSSGRDVDGPGAWPQFHHDPQLTGNAGNAPPFATATRIYGATADATAAAEFEHQFNTASGDCPGDTSTRPVVLATDRAYPDALASASLARELGTGTLLTSTSTLSPVTADALKTEGITRVYVVGGSLAVSTAVVSALESSPAEECGGGAALPSGATIQVTRLAGQTQYDTAEQIAESEGAANVGTVDLAGAYAGVNASGGDGRYNTTAGHGSAGPAAPTKLRTAVVATGQGFQDAEAASTLAYAARLPILLTTPAALSPQVSAAVDDLGIQQVLLMGGQDAVSNAVVTSLEALGVSVLRVAGSNDTATAVELAELETATASGGVGFGWSGTGAVTVARGDFYTDGLAGAVVAADGPAVASPEPLLLTLDPSNPGAALTAFLKGAGATGIGGTKVSKLTVLGGPAAVTGTAIDEMGAALDG